MINKNTEDFEKIVAVTKLKELKPYAKIFYQITINEKYTIQNKANESWKTIWNNVLFWM